MRVIKNIIFDFDGTIADTSRLIIATMQKSIGELGLPLRTEQQCKSTIGIRLIDVPSVLWPGYDLAPEKYADVYRKNFEELKATIAIELFPYVNETLTVLKERGLRMAVATSRSHKSVDELLRQFGLRDKFDAVIGGDDVEKGKPDPEPVDAILMGNSWESGQTIVVGDMGVDILMGKNGGTMTCGVTYGNGTVAELKDAGADYIVDKFNELENICK